MRHTFQALAALGALAAPSVALADPADWTGFYVGADIGGARTQAEVASIDFVNQVTNVNPVGAQPLTVVPATSIAILGEDRKTDLVWGGVAGYQGQSGDWVFGIEGDLHGSRDAGAGADVIAVPGTLLSPASSVTVIREAEIDYDWSLRGKVGYAVDRTLFYAAGGLAAARIELTSIDSYLLPAGTSPGGVVAPALGPIVTTAVDKATMTGWTAGVGVEQQVTDHVTLALDGRYTDYGHKTFDGTQTVTAPPLLDYGEGANAGLPLQAPPNVVLGPSRASLDEWRVTARALWRF